MTGRVAASWRSLRGLVCHVVDLVIAVLFLLVGFETFDALHEIWAHILPVVVGCAVGLDGYGCLVFVEQELHQYVVCLLGVVVEHHLQVGTHREVVVVYPSLLVELAEVGNLFASTVDVDERHERQHHGLVAVAQCGAGVFLLFVFDVIVFLFCRYWFCALPSWDFACWWQGVADVRDTPVPTLHEHVAARQTWGEFLSQPLEQGYRVV